MLPNDYQAQALTTLNPALSQEEVLAMCGLGLAGEAGEVCDLLKKELAHKRAINRIRYLEEMGDTLWYLSVLASTLNIPLEAVMQHNLNKLKARHGNGFTARYASDSGVSLSSEEPTA